MRQENAPRGKRRRVPARPEAAARPRQSWPVTSPRRGRNFDLCYVGTIDCEAEPLGMRLNRLRGCGSVEVFMERAES